MRKIAIILDSTTLESEILNNHPDIYKVPLEVIVNGQTFEDGIAINEEDWIRYLKEDATMSTSQPSLANTLNVLNEVKAKNYDHVYVLPLTSHLSGTYNGFVLAQNEVKVPNCTIVDTLSIAGCITVMAEAVLRYNEEGLGHDEIMEKLEVMMDNNETYIYTPSLKRLIFSGRLNKAVGTLGNLLKLKILLVLKNKGEKIDKHEIFRTEKKVIQEVVNQYKKLGVDENWVIYLLEIEAKERMMQFQDALVAEFGNIEVRHQMLPGVIATHVGIGVVGIQAVKKEK